jgi:hypothetical protein
LIQTALNLCKALYHKGIAKYLKFVYALNH